MNNENKINLPSEIFFILIYISLDVMDRPTPQQLSDDREFVLDIIRNDVMIVDEAVPERKQTIVEILGRQQLMGGVGVDPRVRTCSLWVIFVREINKSWLGPAKPR